MGHLAAVRQNWPTSTVPPGPFLTEQDNDHDHFPFSMNPDKAFAAILLGLTVSACGYKHNPHGRRAGQGQNGRTSRTTTSVAPTLIPNLVATRARLMPSRKKDVLIARGRGARQKQRRSKSMFRSSPILRS